MKTNKKVVRLTETELRQMITEAVAETLEEGKWTNRAMGLAMGAASMFGGNNQAYADSRNGMPETWGDNVETAITNLKNSNMQNVRKGQGNTVYYMTKDGKPGIYTPRSSNYTESDSIQSLFVNNNMNQLIDSAVDGNQIDLSKFKSFKNPFWYKTNISLDGIYNMAQQLGYGSDDFMLYPSQEGDVYIMPNVDNVQELFNANNNIDGLDGI